ncbi:MAG TPA: hypothetical protein VN691_00005 [Steroidobacteraceae bacterium]|nr:hypothetical protein [Steroidobacteraceae bacterium]
MPNTTSAANPVPYYEALSTFWAAACTTRGTDLRGQSLVNLDVLSPVPHGFVAKLESKLRPAGIVDGLRQAGSGKPSGVNVTDDDAPVLLYEPRGNPMKEVPAAVRDFGVDSAHPSLTSGPLGDTQRTFVSAVEARRLDPVACRESCQ